MPYTVLNFKTKKALKEAFKEWQVAHQTSSQETNPGTVASLLVDRYQKKFPVDRTRAYLCVYQPGPFGPAVKDGRTAIEGPHYPEPHRWYADVEVKDGHIIKIYG